MSNRKSSDKNQLNLVFDEKIQVKDLCKSTPSDNVIDFSSAIKNRALDEEYARMRNILNLDDEELKEM